MNTLDIKIYKFRKNLDKYGSLVPVEANDTVPFPIKRAYYIYDVEENVRRGFHSHRELNQVLVCVSGSVKILVKTPFDEEEILLDNPTKALYIGPMIWREMFDFSKDCVLLVFADEHYDEKDYIRIYENYEKQALDFFKSKGIS